MPFDMRISKDGKKNWWITTPDGETLVDGCVYKGGTCLLVHNESHGDNCVNSRVYEYENLQICNWKYMALYITCGWGQVCLSNVNGTIINLTGDLWW